MRQHDSLAVQIPKRRRRGRVFYAEVVEADGCSVIFRHEAKDLVGVIHGDSFVFGGRDEDLKWVAKALAAKFVIKVIQFLV